MSNHSAITAAYRNAPQVVWGYPPGVSIVDTVPEDMLEMIHPHWKKFPPVNPMWHYLLGLVYIFLGATSITGKIQTRDFLN